MCVPTIRSSLSEWLYYIEHLNPLEIDLDLERVRKVAINLNLLNFENCIVILVGGTNGKGTTCFLLESIFLFNGFRVGLYTSPHLICYNERIRVNGQELSDSIHIQAMSVIENARGNISLTYFEFVTLSALYIFRKRKLDVMILEVGVGGRLDATNVVNPDISVITNIAMDHIDLLGVNLYMIAREKSGIFRSGKPAIIGDLDSALLINKINQSRDVILFVRKLHWNYYMSCNEWIWENYSNFYKIIHLPIPIIPLENAATALSVLYYFPLIISEKAIRYGLKYVFVPGRFQIVNYRPLIILDVGHNPHAANYLVKRISMIFPKNGTIRIVIGMLKHKDIRTTIFSLSHIGGGTIVWYCSFVDSVLSADVSQLFDYIRDTNIKLYNIKKFSNIVDAWKQAIKDVMYDDCILVFGSFYSVAPIIKNYVNIKKSVYIR